MPHEKPKDWKKFKKTHEESENREEEPSLEEELEEIQGALDHPSYADLEKKLTAIEQDAFENKEKAVRALAELDNVRRRAARDVENAHRYSVEKLITSLLPVMDSLEQAMQLVDKEAHASMYEGLDLTLKLMLSVLEKQEVVQIDPLGQMFDPQEHEAMTIQEVAGATPNSVLTVFQKGYKLAGRVIRPARVIVAKK